MTELIGKLQFICEYECKTDDEKKAVDEAIDALKELKWWRDIGTEKKYCFTCKYRMIDAYTEPCISCVTQESKWVCGYEGGDGG